MNAFHCLTDEDEAETQEQVLEVVSFTTEEDDSKAVECLDEGGEPFETPKHESRKISKKHSQTKNKALKLAKQKRMEAWQRAETKRIEALQDAEKKRIAEEEYRENKIENHYYEMQKNQSSQCECGCFGSQCMYDEDEDEDEGSGGWCYNEYCECNT